MRSSGSFERRLLAALVAFSLIPTLLLVGVGTLMLREAVSLQTTPAGWERLGETGRQLLDLTADTDDPAIAAAAEAHRNELSVSIQQAQRWGYINRRVLTVMPWISLAFVGILGYLAVRSARRIARDLSRPIGELVGWAGMVGRGERLPDAGSHEADRSPEFAILRSSFRSMTSELETARQREIEAERMKAAVGIARGVAHELKNVLTPLRLAVGTLLRRQAPDAHAREAIEVIDAESQRLDTLARAFAQLGHPPEGPVSEIDLAELIDHLARTHVPDRIRAETSFDSRLPHILGHYDPLSRAFSNLIQNAVEAIGEGVGTIRIIARTASPETVEVRIRDSGPGIEPGMEKRIWEPDFTTKSRGTGLGLALVRQAVTASGGEIEAFNSDAGGAEMVVVLPTAMEATVARSTDRHLNPELRQVKPDFR